MVTVLSPAEWGATVGYDNWNDPYTPDEGVVLHHGGGSNYEAGRTPFTREKEVRLLKVWERYHLSKGWRGLAYGWAVGQTGTVYRIRGWNRYGAHLGDVDGDGIANNEELIPIVWLLSGNHHDPGQLMQASTEWLRRTIIEPRAPGALWLSGHQEVQLSPTSCPGPKGMSYVRDHRYLGESDMAFNHIYEKWTSADIDAMRAKDLFGGDAKYWKDDIGIYSHDWDHFTAVVLAANAARPDSTDKVGISQAVGDARYVRKGQPVSIKGLG